MTGFKGITVNTAPEAPAHITAEDDAAIYASILGGDGVASIGKKCKATLVSNNLVKIEDGVVVIGGHIGRILPGDSVNCNIDNGQTGVNRNDLIIAKFESKTGNDVMSIEVKKGVPGSIATDPNITAEDIYSNGKIREVALYRVKIEGLNIVAVEQMFNVLENMSEMQKEAKIYSNKVKAIGKFAHTGTHERAWTVGKSGYTDIGNEIYPINNAYFQTSAGVSKISVKQKGVYLIGFTGKYNNPTNPNDKVWLEIKRNGQRMTENAFHVFHDGCANFTKTALLEAGDYIEAGLSSTSGELKSYGSDTLQVTCLSLE